MIQRYTSNITILYDGDPAGIKASFRGIDMIVEHGMNVKIVLFPDGEDPDSYARKHHPTEVQAFIADNASNFILFKTRLLLGETKNDPIKKVALIREIVNTIGLIPDPISRTLYIRECSSIMAISEQILQNELNKILRDKLRKSTPELDKAMEEIPAEQVTAEPQLEIDYDSAEYQEKEIIRLLLLYGKEIIMLKSKDPDEDDIPVLIADYVVNDLLHDNMGFENEIFKTIFGEYVTGLENDKMPDRDFFLYHPDKVISGMAIDLVFTPYELSPNWHKNNIMITTEETRIMMHVELSLHAFKSRKLDKMMTDVGKQMAKATSDEELSVLQRTFHDLKSKSVRINKEGLGRIVTR